MSSSRSRGSAAALIAIAVGVGLVVVLMVGALAGAIGFAIARNEAPSATAATVSHEPSARPVARSAGTIADVVSRSLPAVVTVAVDAGTSSGTGSGFVVRADGYVLTNNHVVDAAVDQGTITVIRSDGTRLGAKIVGRNTSYDLAVLKVDAKDLPVLRLGDSDAVKVGDSVIAIGAPLRLDGTVTAGIVSAVDRPVTTQGSQDTAFISAIQTDAAINPGNSGGPLLDGQGSVIGVNSAIATMASGGGSGSIGLGFAIPINSAKRIARELIDTGTSADPVVGVKLDLRFAGDGAKISSVERGGPAERAGLRVGDVIVEADGRILADANEFVVAIRDHAPGDLMRLVLLRDGERQDVTVTLGSRSE